jgi:hypothetical protein
MSGFTYTQKHCIVMPLKACRLMGSVLGSMVTVLGNGRSIDE